MQKTSVPPSEQQIIEQYNELKQTLINQAQNQMDSAQRMNTQMTQLFQNILQLFNILTAKIAALKQQNIELKSGNKKNYMINHAYSEDKQDSLGDFDQQNKNEYDIREYGDDRSNIFKQYQSNGFNKLMERQSPSNQFIKFQGIGTMQKSSKNKQEEFEFKNDSEDEQKVFKPPQYQAKNEGKQAMKRQYAVIAKYVKQYIAPSFVYDKDHKKYVVPKKHILHEYFRWCKVNNRPILENKSSVIQMCLTNQLKLLFPLMDSYTKNYRGLRKSSTVNTDKETSQHSYIAYNLN